MIKRIFRHDLRLIKADKTLIAFAAIFAVLIGYAVASGVIWANERDELVRQWYADGEEYLATNRQVIADIEQGKKSAEESPFADWVWVVKLRAALPPAPLTSLSVGRADLYPFTASVDLYSKKNDLFKNYETDNPTTLLAGRFDPAFVIIYLYPLLIFALTYNLLAREREDGTLLLTLAQPVSLRDVVIGKAAARLFAALTLVIGFTLVSLVVGGVNFAAPGAGVGIVWWLLLVIAYTLFWFAVALWVNARGSASATNATILVGLWLLFVVIVPSLLSIAVTSFYPVPSRLEFIRQMRSNDNEVGRTRKNLLEQYHRDHSELVSDGTVNSQSRWYVFAEEEERRTLPLVRSYDEQLTRQQNLVDRLRFLSPAVVMQEASNAIAGTDRARYHHFHEQVEAFVDEWRAYSVPRSFRQINLRSSDYDSLPRFIFREESDASVTNRAFAGLLGLLLPTILIGVFALRCLKCYPLVESR